MSYRLLSVALCLLVLVFPLSAGETGKIAGRVQDAQTGEALVGISVVIEGSTMGASTDIDGQFTIISVPPGTYTVAASGVGFQRRRITNVKVSIDFTTRLEFRLGTEEITLDAVEVEAEAPMIRRDLTSTQTVVDAATIQALPVENVTQVLTLQAGIIQGAGGEIHIRGGRSTEISYTVNGVSIVNPFDNSRSVQIATNAIQELSVVSGTFNAEYGNALSGVVNTVTKEGGQEYRGSLSYYTGDMVSSRTDVFTGIDDYDPLNRMVLEGTLSGPIPLTGNMLSVFLSARYDKNKGYLNGIRQHNPTDYVYKDPLNPNDITVIATGDGAVVAMNPSTQLSTTGKLSFALTPTMKLRYDILYSNSEYQSYNHSLKYNPDANPTSYDWGWLNALEFRHAVGSTTFYTVRGSYSINDFQSYLYPLVDPAGTEVSFHAGMSLDTTLMRADGRYPDPALGVFGDYLYQPGYKDVLASTYTFSSGGTQNGHYYQRTQSGALKADITSQVTQSHELKGGLEYRNHQIDYRGFSVLRDTIRYFAPTIPGTNTVYHTAYVKFPEQFSAYVQDKMEFESIILNVGVRFDYFWARSKYAPDIFLPSPNSPTLPPDVDPASVLADAAPKNQWSPRLGVSFPITDRGIIHFSYGHFFQMPPFQYLFANPDFKASFSTGSPVFGNSDLNPEKTVTYEIGLQQQLGDNLAINVTGFYKDVRDLLALQQIRISSDETYFKYVNKDYANIRGITFSLTKRRTAGDLLGVSIDYTFQAAEGNETNSDAFFLDLSSGRQSEKIPVYLSWDQTHTLNAMVSVGEPNDWNIAVVGRFGTGLPYTPQDFGRSIELKTNSERKPQQATVDLLADKTFDLGSFGLSVFLKIYNVFDTLNERLVYTDTGRATYTLLMTQGPALETEKISTEVPGVHPASEYFVQPQYYLPPREVRFGLTIEF